MAAVCSKALCVSTHYLKFIDPNVNSATGSKFSKQFVLPIFTFLVIISFQHMNICTHQNQEPHTHTLTHAFTRTRPLEIRAQVSIAGDKI